MKTVTLSNSNGMTVTVVDFGARIASIMFPVKGQPEEMTVTHQDINQLHSDPFYLGAICGPVCNRISGASFELQGRRYQLNENDGGNCLHGGHNNLSLRTWNVLQKTKTQVSLEIELDHLEDGFPGHRVITVTYHLCEANILSIDLKASTDRSTPVNLTNHAYFHLGEGSAKELYFSLASNTFLEKDDSGLPTGRLVRTSETGFDLNCPTPLNEFVVHNNYEQINVSQGVDHCFLLKRSQEVKATLYSPRNKIRLEVKTDQPAVQLYSGTFLSSPFDAYQGVCIECQGYTDAVNQPHFESVVIEKGSSYQRNISYRFIQQ